MTHRLRASAFLLALLSGSVAHADYFLNGSQKLDLITHGEINGEDGARYDIWVVPGYTGPLRNAKGGWVNAGHDFAEYGHADLYEDTFSTSKRMLRFAGKESIGKFAFKGSYEAWGDAFDAASERTHKRVFGWWFAYPWAVFEATGESVVRVALGVPTGILAGGAGSTIVPVAELAWPAVKGTYHSTVPGTVLPLAAGGWNTVIAPPMALIGQQPNAARADGFWVTRVDPANADPELAATREALRAWGKTVMSTPEVLAANAEQAALRASYDRQREEMLAQLNTRYKHDQAEVQERRSAVIQEQAAQHPPTAEDVQKLQAMVQRYGRDRVVSSLWATGLTKAQADELLSPLIGPDTGAETVAPVEKRREGDKTDPLKRSLELGTKTY